MVLPIIGMGALLAFVAFGEDLVGKKLFKQIIIVIGLLAIGIVGYFIYQIYTAKEKVKDIFEDKWGWITKGAGEETTKVLEEDVRWEDKPEIEKDVIWTGEMISQLFGGSAYSAGQTTAQKTYDSFEDRYGIDIAQEYEELPGTGRALVSLGDYLTGGRAVDAGREVRRRWDKLWGK